ncbi:zinc metalloproteinase nas-4 [Embiotoca jacksoni]|uniref:zinc metalloproteinase nas-4 n=1 Tax=Embiotoca jacksoni TaxID=100190 RepID=UPI003704603A
MLHLVFVALLVFAGGFKDALLEEALIKAVHYIESNPETLEELMSKDHTVSEGDLLLPSDRNTMGNTWPTLDIPYVISSSLASRMDDILSAMATVSKHTCLSFHERTSERDYVIFQVSRGCASYVGIIGGKQPMFIGPSCTVGNIIHEILHAVGFHHEHTRTDREQYITVLSHNIMPGMEKNFAKHGGETFNLPYDITSILHYGSGFFSSNGFPTIVSKKHEKEMGQRAKMTKMDIKKVRHLYNCEYDINVAHLLFDQSNAQGGHKSLVSQPPTTAAPPGSFAAPEHHHQRAL